MNLNGLLVTHQIDNNLPGGVPGGKSAPGSTREYDKMIAYLWFIYLQIRQS